MLFIEIMLAALALFTGIVVVIGLLAAARRISDYRDPMLAACIVACPLSLGFLGLLLK